MKSYTYISTPYLGYTSMTTRCLLIMGISVEQLIKHKAVLAQMDSLQAQPY